MEGINFIFFEALLSYLNVGASALLLPMGASGYIQTERI